MTKRAVDILGASLGLIVLAPVLGLLWIMIRTKLGAPVIFAQQRPGKDGRLFTMLKFRSMLEEDPTKGLLTDDQRMTSFGRRLRASSLDELPTLVNVLKGEMSLVGPRPLNVEYLGRYSPHQARRHEVRPGITGLAQVNGRNALSWEDRFDLDVYYVDHHNLWLDFKIMAQTIARVFAKSDIEGELTSTMTMFVGEPPRDGLTEQPLKDRWEDLWDSWQRSPATLKIGDHDGAAPDTTHHWVYLDDTDTPVGIAGLSGLGGPHLHASIVLGPNNQTATVLEALLNRLLYHGQSYDAHRIFLRLSDTNRKFSAIAQLLGFVPLDLPEQQGVPTDDGEVLVAFAAQTGT
jgi:lipopolysaccharide/colanic/teichoic acid biosynthesis glycosyltransferase